MPRRLGVPYRWRGWKLYGDALAWAFVYPIMNGVVLVATGLICVVSYLILGSAWPAVVVGPLLMLVVLGVGNAYCYALWQAKNLQIKRGRAFGAYMLVVLMANVLYLAFAASYGTIAGVI